MSAECQSRRVHLLVQLGQVSSGVQGCWPVWGENSVLQRRLTEFWPQTKAKWFSLHLDTTWVRLNIFHALLLPGVQVINRWLTHAGVCSCKRCHVAVIARIICEILWLISVCHFYKFCLWCDPTHGLRLWGKSCWVFPGSAVSVELTMSSVTQFFFYVGCFCKFVLFQR